jgi:ribosomal protein S18 acetylase RimI-like enzyme
MPGGEVRGKNKCREAVIDSSHQLPYTEARIKPWSIRLNRSKKVPGNIVFSPVTEADLPPIKSLLIELTEAMEDTEGLDVSQFIENTRQLLHDPAHHLLVARENNKVIGFVNFTTRKTIMHPGPSGLIDELVVSQEYRGSGIGRELIQAVIEKCRSIGCCEVEVSTEKSNTRARRFYKSCGFNEDAVLMEIDLD